MRRYVTPPAVPDSTLLCLPGLNHDTAQAYGRPATITAARRLFFAH